MASRPMGLVVGLIARGVLVLERVGDSVRWA